MIEFTGVLPYEMCRIFSAEPVEATKDEGPRTPLEKKSRAPLKKK